MTPLIHFHHADQPGQLASELADYVATRLRDGLAQRGQALLIVSGGSTPLSFFEALSGRELDWSRVVITLADERCLPAEHADSNARLVRAHLLRGRAAAARFVPLYAGQTSAQAVQADAEHALAGLPWPADVVVLGMGGDGHTASLFPHAAELAGLRADAGEGGQEGRMPRCMSVAAPSLPNVPVPRVTLTARALLDARQLVVHITGAAKLALLQQAMAAGPVSQWPIRLALHQVRVPCAVFHCP